MATIEVTAPLVGLAVGWATSTLAAVWIASRRSKLWDEVEDALYVLFGDRKTGLKGLVAKHDDLIKEHELLKSEVIRLRARQRGALRALHAHGSDEHDVEQAVKATLSQEAQKAVQKHAALSAAIRSSPHGLPAITAAQAKQIVGAVFEAEDDPFPSDE